MQPLLTETTNEYKITQSDYALIYKGDTMKQNQKEAVFAAICSVLVENNIEFSEGMDVGTVMSRELRAQVNNILFHGFKNGDIQLDREFSDTDLKAYVSGLQSNWIRKDKRLNGGTQYVAKNPGSRAGSGDAQLKAMRALISTLTSPADKAEVQKHIDARVAEIALTKTSTKVIDYSALPAALATKFSK